MRMIVVLAALAWAGPAAAAGTQNLGAFGTWEAYATGEGPQKICYMTAVAGKVQGGEKGRAATSAAVTHRAKNSGEISLTGPYGFKPKTDIEVIIAGMNHTFFGQGSTAWAKDAAADKALAQAMAKGREMVVKAVPAKGSAITDTVSLAGFGLALAAIDKACGVKRPAG